MGGQRGAARGPGLLLGDSQATPGITGPGAAWVAEGPRGRVAPAGSAPRRLGGSLLPLGVRTPPARVKGAGLARGTSAPPTADAADPPPPLSLVPIPAPAPPPPAPPLRRFRPVELDRARRSRRVPIRNDPVSRCRRVGGAGPDWRGRGRSRGGRRGVGRVRGGGFVAAPAVFGAPWLPCACFFPASAACCAPGPAARRCARSPQVSAAPRGVGPGREPRPPLQCPLSGALSARTCRSVSLVAIPLGSRG